MPNAKPPTESRHCLNCGRKLAATFETALARKELSDGYVTVEVYTGRVLGYGYQNCNMFCTETCGFRYGARCAHAGVRLDSLDPTRAKR